MTKTIRWGDVSERELKEAYSRHKIDEIYVIPYFNPVSIRQARTGVFFGRLELYLAVETVIDGAVGLHYFNGQDSFSIRTGGETRTDIASSKLRTLEKIGIDRVTLTTSLDAIIFAKNYEKINLDELMRLLKLRGETQDPKDKDLKLKEKVIDELRKDYSKLVIANVKLSEEKLMLGKAKLERDNKQRDSIEKALKKQEEILRKELTHKDNKDVLE